MISIIDYKLAHALLYSLCFIVSLIALEYGFTESHFLKGLSVSLFLMLIGTVMLIGV